MSPGRGANAVESLVRYLEMSVRPTDLAVFYPHPEQIGPFWRVAGTGLLVTVLSIAAVVARRSPYKTACRSSSAGL